MFKRTVLGPILAMHLATAAAPGPAQELDGGLLPLGLPEPLAHADLDRLRGGLVGNDGLSIAFGFENVVRVNGELIVQNSLRVPNIGSANPLDASSTTIIRPGAMDSGTLVRTFSGNGGNLATLIQNSANAQLVENLKLIDIRISDVRALGAPRWNNLTHRGVIDNVSIGR
jgi:hypothetical protein